MRGGQDELVGNWGKQQAVKFSEKMPRQAGVGLGHVFSPQPEAGEPIRMHLGRISAAGILRTLAGGTLEFRCGGM